LARIAEFVVSCETEREERGRGPSCGVDGGYVKARTMRPIGDARALVRRYEVVSGESEDEEPPGELGHRRRRRGRPGGVANARRKEKEYCGGVPPQYH